ncbi:hypothetical protein AA0312_2344 [Acetobacter tropicalis NRIC 0312]|uniref:Uncharacterized protein n=1 Tax=Acetobacter tropicalis TaxID=104102 RepID=A0A511FQZ5_9PROT|nr:hypothetical protein [Acetobacter tropicalis]KXV49683.1 hypothetical protein AD944_07040 [Acetobacter tropicalis]GAL96887.1 membrane protein [Acetobacter tropicalis]GBR71517.1 hypothetical protein AA0312_2344 [Acetobacter tropicalis NRIC 0312]GEL51376.1 hypothetical protein ATR01nite_24510 [Acetobacter tropicalis]
MEDSKPAGWHADTKGKTHAWTNGNAVLPLGDLLTTDTMALLSLSIHAAGPYLVEPDAQTTMMNQYA